MMAFRASGRKYGNVPTPMKGRSYLSQGEAGCALYLQQCQQAGAIRELQYQVTIRLGPNHTRWVLDFKFVDVPTGKTVYADFKGLETDRWKHLVDLWAICGPLDTELRVYKGAYPRLAITASYFRQGDWV